MRLRKMSTLFHNDFYSKNLDDPPATEEYDGLPGILAGRVDATPTLMMTMVIMVMIIMIITIMIIMILTRMVMILTVAMMMAIVLICGHNHDYGINNKDDCNDYNCY